MRLNFIRNCKTKPQASMVLVLGHRVSGRGDCNLGPSLAKVASAWHIPGVTFREDPLDSRRLVSIVAAHPVVIFAAADATCEPPFVFTSVDPASATAWTESRVTPATLLSQVAQDFGAHPRGFLMAIRGYEFTSSRKDLSESAHANLEAALRFLEKALREGWFDAA